MYQRNQDGLARSLVTNVYTGSGSAWSDGAVVSSTAVNSFDDGGGYVSTGTSLSSYSYQWWDGATRVSESFDADTGDSGNAIGTTAYTLDGHGRVALAAVSDGAGTRGISYVHDAAGQVLTRTE